MLKFIITLQIILFPVLLLAHHTKDHLMLQADPQQVIDSTQRGMVFQWEWLLWFLLCFVLVIGLIRQWKNK